MSRIPVGTLASGLPYTTPTNLTLSVSGPGKHGEVQTVTSTWDGDPAPVLTYQWQRDGVAISGATAATYTPVADDVGKALRVVVTGTNHMGPVAVISSAVTVAGRIDATGGIIRTSGGYTYHTFTSSSALTITTNTANRTLEYQVIGGGGGGGHSLVPKTGQECAGGGGGGGRFASGSFANVGTGNFTVTVGGGGSASGNQPNNGTGSAFHNSGSFGTGVGLATSLTCHPVVVTVEATGEQEIKETLKPITPLVEAAAVRVTAETRSITAVGMEATVAPAVSLGLLPQVK